MKIAKFYVDRHYKRMSELWTKAGWIPCPVEALPGIGIVAETDTGEFIAYLGMYMEPAKIGFIDWALSDQGHGIAAGKALCRLLDKLIQAAKDNNCHFIYSTTKIEAWKKILIYRGMKTAEQGADTFIMSLNNADTAFISD